MTDEAMMAVAAAHVAASEIRQAFESVVPGRSPDSPDGFIFAYGILLALRYPEWARAFAKALPTEITTNNQWMDITVEAFPMRSVND